jgi:hypothetical protein
LIFGVIRVPQQLAGGAIDSRAPAASAGLRLGNQNATCIATLFGPKIAFYRHCEDNQMKNPLDSLWGTIISGLILTLILYNIIKHALGG